MAYLLSSMSIRSTFNRALAALLFLFLPVDGVFGAIGKIGQYRVVRREPFEYRFSGHEETFIAEFDRKLRRLTPLLEERLGRKIPAGVVIDLPLTRSEFAFLTRGRAPDWAGGIAYPDQKRVVIKAPAFFRGGAEAEVLTAHELSHILLNEATAGKGLPRWFEEGLCQNLAGEKRSGSLARLAQAAIADRMMGLPRVDDVLDFAAPDAELAYAESNAAVESFVSRYGWSGVRALLSRIANDEEFPEAFEAVAGVEYEYWQADWLEGAQKKFKRYLFLNVEDMIWALIVLLAIAAVMAAWVKKRWQFKKWLEEEEEDERSKEPDATDPALDYSGDPPRGVDDGGDAERFPVDDGSERSLDAESRGSEHRR